MTNRLTNATQAQWETMRDIYSAMDERAELVFLAALKKMKKLNESGPLTSGENPLTEPTNRTDLTAMDMLEKQLAKNTINAFHAALCRFQEETPYLETEQDGSRRLATLVETIKKPLANNGLSIRWGAFSSGNNDISGSCYLAHKDGHEELASFRVGLYAYDELIPAHRYDAAVTQIKRITLEMVCGLASSENDEVRGRYADLRASREATPPPQPDATPDLAELDRVKMFWAQTVDADTKEAMKTWTKKLKREAFYDWLTVSLDLNGEQRLKEDSQVTAEILTKALDLMPSVGE